VRRQRPVWEGFHRRHVYTAVGAFVLISGVLVVFSLSYFRLRWTLGEKTFPISAAFDANYGLRRGSQVTVAGIPAGTVQTVGFNERNEVEVLMAIRESMRTRIRADSSAQVTWPSLVGPCVVEITPGSVDSAIVTDHSTLPTRATRQVQGQDMAGIIFETGELVRSINDPEGPFMTGVTSMAAVAGRLERGLGSAGLLIQDDGGFYRNGDRAVGHLADFLEGDDMGVPVRMVRGSEMIITADERLDARMEELTALLERVDGIITPIAEGKGTLGALVKSDEVYVEMVGLLKELRVLAEKTRGVVEDLSLAVPILPGLVETSMGTLEEAQRALDGLKRSFLMKDLVEPPEPVVPEALYRQAEPAGEAQ